MTLIVGRHAEDDIFLIADTKFTADANKGWSQSRMYVGGLKLVILSPGLCVGFAGNVEIARNAIQGIYDKNLNLFDKKATLDYFLDHHIRSMKFGVRESTDFIVACIGERNEQPGTYVKELFRIANSKTCLENQTLYIGDQPAFACYQENLHRGRSKAGAPLFEIMLCGREARPGFDEHFSASSRAMQAAIDDPGISSVDGVRTVVVSEDDQFRYVEYLQLRGQTIVVNDQPGSPVSFGGAEEGADHKHVGMFSAIGHGVFPVYSLTGSFGLIYHPERSFEPRVCRNCTLDEFQAEVQQRLADAHERALAYQALHPE